MRISCEYIVKTRNAPRPVRLTSAGSFGMLLNLRRGEIILFEVAPLNQIRDHSSGGALELKCTNKTQSNHSLTKGEIWGGGNVFIVQLFCS